MASSLLGQNVNDTYDSLIKVGDNGVVTSTLKQVSDGLGNEFPMKISSTQVVITGSLSGSASTATSASFATNATSASYAATASFVQNAVSASYVLNAVSASFASTASFVQNAISSSFASTASFVQNAQTASYVLNAISASYAATASFVQNAVSASYVLNAISSSFASTASFVRNAQTASYVQNAVSASYVLNAVSASYVLNAVSASFATTASYVRNAVSASYAATASTADYATLAALAANASNASAADTVDVTTTAANAEYRFPIVAGTGQAVTLYTESEPGALSYNPGTNRLTISGGVDVHYIDFETAAVPAFAEGRVNWVDDTKTLAIDTDVNGVQIEVGHQTITRVRNENPFTILKGRVVYMSGSSGNRPLIYTSSWESDPTSAGTLGLVAADITQNSNGYVITNGLIRDLNTSMFTAGQPLYLSSSGQITSASVISPLHEVRLGKVVTSHATTGIIYVDIDNGYEVGELHDVIDNSTNSTHGALLVKSGSVWKDGYQLTGSYGLTGSLSATSFTGSLQGTASWAINVVNGGGGGPSYITPPFFTGSILYWDGTKVTGSNVMDYDGSSLNIDTGYFSVAPETQFGQDVTIYGSAYVESGARIYQDTVADAIVLEKVDPIGATSGSYGVGSHILRNFSSTGPTLTPGRIVYLSGSGQWAEAIASGDTTSTGVLGVVTTVANQNNILLSGMVRVSQSLAGFTNGSPVYLATSSAGTITQTPPSTVGHVARYVGYVLDSGSRQIYFNPDFTWIQL